MCEMPATERVLAAAATARHRPTFRAFFGKPGPHGVAMAPWHNPPDSCKLGRVFHFVRGAAPCSRNPNRS